MLLQREERRYHRKVSILVSTRLCGHSDIRSKFLSLYMWISWILSDCYVTPSIRSICKVYFLSCRLPSRDWKTYWFWAWSIILASFFFGRCSFFVERYFFRKGSPSLCIEKMHTTFFISLFNKGWTKSIHQKTPKPPHNTYKADNERGSCQQSLVLEIQKNASIS
jgi:hypothetical protein